MGQLFTLPSGQSLGLALAATLFCGLLVAAFAAWQRSRFTREALALDGEQVLKQGPANHFRGLEGVGGRLYLTDKRLLFRSHRFNVQNHELSIPLGEILEARSCSTALVIPNELYVVAAEGAERFVVEGRRSWVEEISRAKKQSA